MEGWVSPDSRCKEQLANGCYATHPRPALDSNPRPRGRWSSALTTRLSRHPRCFRQSAAFVLSSMSRENLLTMRPRGVRSKKETGALMTVENNNWWRRPDALISTFHNTKHTDIGLEQSMNWNHSLYRGIQRPHFPRNNSHRNFKKSNVVWQFPNTTLLFSLH